MKLKTMGADGRALHVNDSIVAPSGAAMTVTGEDVEPRISDQWCGAVLVETEDGREERLPAFATSAGPICWDAV